MGVEVSEGEIEKLVEEHVQELITNELVGLNCEKQQEVMEEVSSEDKGEKNEESLTPNEIRKCVKYGKQ